VIWLLSGLLAAQAPSPSPAATDAIALLEIAPVPGTDLTALQRSTACKALAL
jgi:hypothetical protein